MQQNPNRIDGWKAIAQYFGRDRTTVMRWARSRNLPVRRVPGGGSSSVYALANDLDGWLAGESAAVAQGDRRPAYPKWLPWIGVTLAVLAIAGALYLGRVGSGEAPPNGAAKLPADPEVATLYLQARDDWAQRNPASLRRALAGLGQVVNREPGFAPGHTGLAEAYLLAREYDAVPEDVAYPKAKAAAQAALALDPKLADAHRALGFIQYWWDREPAQAGASFRAARRLAPADAQTHHWYGNILHANGQFEAALRELDNARLLDPGSVAIRSDAAWALWPMGQEAEARRRLDELVRGQPDYCSPHSYLAVMNLAARNYRGYLRETAESGRTCGDPRRTARAARDAGIFAREGEAGLLRAVIVAAQDDVALPRATREWLAFTASVARDRPLLVTVLGDADERRETWTWAALAHWIALEWPADTEIQDLLARRETQGVE